MTADSAPVDSVIILFLSSGRGSETYPTHLLTLEQVMNMFTSSHPPFDSEKL